MLNDFDMVIHKFDNSITVIPVSDVHIGALEHNKTKWESFVKSVLKEPDTYLTLGGDLVNNSTRCSVANPFDEVLRPREQKQRMVEYLKPLAAEGRILCAVSGNHEYRTTKETDQDITYDIMSKLDIEDLYRENAVFMKVGLGKRSNANKPVASYTLMVQHGAGGGIYTGATVNRNERFGNVIDGLDCMIVGHTHKGTVSKPSKIVIDSNNNTVSLKSYTVVSTVSWLNYAGYALRKMLLPAESCEPQKIKLRCSQQKRIECLW